VVFSHSVFGPVKSESHNVASRQQAITTTYEKLVQAAEVSVYVCVCVFVCVCGLGCVCCVFVCCERLLSVWVRGCVYVDVFRHVSVFGAFTLLSLCFPVCSSADAS